jgi:hypothetical protein
MKLTDLITPEELKAAALEMEGYGGPMPTLSDEVAPYVVDAAKMFTVVRKREEAELAFAGYMLALRHINFALQRKGRPS